MAPGVMAHAAPSPPMIIQDAIVTSAGNVTATFSIPGRSNIPSDGADHQVTIATLQLEAILQWVAVPSLSAQTHLKANINNASEYTFLPGQSSVYLDGSFISTSPVPSVSPQESFDCPLGVDTSIRIAHHPRTEKASKSGFYSKLKVHAYSQRVTVFNTRTQPVENVIILSQVPVSQDSAITVKITNPALPSSQQQQTGTTGSSDSKKGAEIVKVSSSVSAEWEDDKEGRFKWTVKLAPQQKLVLESEWEVSAAADVVINGL